MSSRGSDVVLEILASEGVRHVFGNPGTTELPLLDALRDGGPEYVLALHEGVAIGMADGYAQVTHRPSFVNLHTASGLGNAMGVLSNVKTTRTPMVVTAGQQHQGHLQSEPFLSGDLVPIASANAKWAREVHRVDDLGLLLRRAFRDAAHQPTGPVFLSIPMDLLDEETRRPTPAATRVRERVVPAAFDDLAERIERIAPGRLAIVAGDEVARSEGVGELVALAEKLGAPVFGTPLHSNLVFPPTHAQWAGALPSEPVAASDALGRFAAALVIGDRPFMSFVYEETEAIPEHLEIVHLSPEPSDLGRSFPAAFAAVGDPKATLGLLAERLRTSEAPLVQPTPVSERRTSSGLPPSAVGARPDDSLDAEAVIAAVLRAVPPETRIVDEGPTTDPFVRRHLRASLPDRFFYSRGGGLGWGMGAALGISLATEEAVLCVVGDGSALYGPQALWTAARQTLPVVFLVMNNRSYSILRRFMDARDGAAAGTRRSIGTDLTDPEVDFSALAGAFGVPARSPRTADEAAAAVAEAIVGDGPVLVQVPIVAT